MRLEPGDRNRQFTPNNGRGPAISVEGLQNYCKRAPHNSDLTVMLSSGYVEHAGLEELMSINEYY
jgi:hypothetical protein